MFSIVWLSFLDEDFLPFLDERLVIPEGWLSEIWCCKSFEREENYS
jgi:hypothetical protein